MNYKFTRENQYTREQNSKNKDIKDRIYIFKEKQATINIKINSWIDLN